MGIRQACNLDEPVQLLHDFEKALTTVLRGIVQPDRIDYFIQFVKRRTALAIKAVSTPPEAQPPATRSGETKPDS